MYPGLGINKKTGGFSVVPMVLLRWGGFRRRGHAAAFGVTGEQRAPREAVDREGI